MSPVTETTVYEEDNEGTYVKKRRYCVIETLMKAVYTY